MNCFVNAVRSKFWGSIAACIALNSCAPQHNLIRSDIRQLPFSGGPGGVFSHVRGMREALDHQNGPVRVLVLHGMLVNEPNYSLPMQRNLVRELALDEQRPQGDSLALQRGYDIVTFSGAAPDPADPDTVKLKSSWLRRTTWFSRGPNRHARVVFYEVLWAPYRDQVKQRYFATFETSNRPSAEGALPNAGHRTWGNWKAKEHLMVGGFSDATLVLSPLGNVLRDDVILAMTMLGNDILQPDGAAMQQFKTRRCQFLVPPGNQEAAIAAGMRLEQTPIFAITHSLGSFLLMDLHERLVSEHPEDPAADQRRTLLADMLNQATVFMRANQIPMLRLGQLSAWCVAPDGQPCPNTHLPALSDLQGSISAPQQTTYVAFNDVNDLLGYELPPYLGKTGLFGALVNVTVNNPSGWRIPFVVRDPAGAHSNSYKNPAVIKAMVHGFDVPPLLPASAGLGAGRR